MSPEGPPAILGSRPSWLKGFWGVCCGGRGVLVMFIFGFVVLCSADAGTSDCFCVDSAGVSLSDDDVCDCD